MNSSKTTWGSTQSGGLTGKTEMNSVWELTPERRSGWRWGELLELGVLPNELESSASDCNFPLDEERGMGK